MTGRGVSGRENLGVFCRREIALLNGHQFYPFLCNFLLLQSINISTSLIL